MKVLLNNDTLLTQLTKPRQSLIQDSAGQNNFRTLPSQRHKKIETKLCQSFMTVLRAMRNQTFCVPNSLASMQEIKFPRHGSPPPCSTKNAPTQCARLTIWVSWGRVMNIDLAACFPIYAIYVLQQLMNKVLAGSMKRVLTICFRTCLF